MKSKLLAMLAILSALSCQPSVTVQKPATGEGPMKNGSPTMSAIGFRDNVDWECHQADFNENLIWIECKFQNLSMRNQRVCIRAIISDDHNQEVDRSRLVCSNDMVSGAVYENTAAFCNSKHSRQRDAITVRCGLDGSRCHLSVPRFPAEQ